MFYQELATHLVRRNKENYILWKMKISSNRIGIRNPSPLRAAALSTELSSHENISSTSLHKQRFRSKSAGTTVSIHNLAIVRLRHL